MPPSNMSVQKNPHTWTATEAREQISNNTITVQAYAQALLDRIAERHDIVKAWAYLGKSCHRE